ncbi:efflux transporter outer membrane subunit, partial [Brevundimonas nasdae]
RYEAGIAPRTDVLQAETTLANARSTRIGLERNRATYENAIAVLVGEPASSFTLAPAQWTPIIPEVPVGVPSTLLERRPDIASAERAVAAANARIGVQQAAFFPNLSLTGSYGQTTSNLGDLFASSTNIWSLGLGLAETLFDAGARGAAVEQARASYDASVAAYRQTVLTAFQDVENQLTATDVLRRQYAELQTASQAADQTEAMILNQYRAGTVAYTDVATAQATALTARRALLQGAVNRQTTAVALIQSIGGGWRNDQGD